VKFNAYNDLLSGVTLKKTCERHNFCVNCFGISGYCFGYNSTLEKLKASFGEGFFEVYSINSVCAKTIADSSTIRRSN
jgi:hypothetical protein